MVLSFAAVQVSEERVTNFLEKASSGPCILLGISDNYHPCITDVNS